MKKIVLLLAIFQGVFAAESGMDQGSHIVFGQNPQLRCDRSCKTESSSVSAVNRQYGIQAHTHGASTVAYKDLAKASSVGMAAIDHVKGVVSRYLRTTDIKGLLEYRDELEDMMYSRPVHEHEEIVAKIDQLDYQLNTVLAPLVKCYRDCNDKRLKGDWIFLNGRDIHLMCRLKDPDLSPEVRLKLQQEKDLVSRALHDPSTLAIMVVREGEPRVALRYWRNVEQWRRNGQIDSEAFQAARAEYLEREELHELEDSAAQSEQSSQALVLEQTRLIPSISEQLSEQAKVASGKLEDVTDMTTDKPTIWYGNTLSAEKTALFAAYHQEVHEALIREGVIDRDMPRAARVAELFIETLAHELHPNQIKRDIDGIAQLAKDVAHSATSPINGVQGRSHLGHPHPRVIAALEAGVSGAQEIARRLVTPMEGADKSPLAEVLRAAGDLTPEQIAIISAKVTADWIKFEALSTVGAYVSQADVLGKVRGGESIHVTKEFERTSVMAKGLHPELDRNMSELERLHDAIERAKERATSEKFRHISDGASVQEFEKIEQQAIDFYEKIRECCDDVSIISKNTGVPEDIITRIKSHVFLDEHLTDAGVGRFFPDGNIAKAWQRLMDNTFAESDLLLLQHEYAESFIMNGTQVSWREAHDMVDKLYNWDMALKG